MSDPVASIVIPTYGRPVRIVECLEALQRQDFPEPWEVVVVDDGSAEPVEPLLAGRSMPAATRIIRQPNSGPAAARNCGVRESGGAIIAFTDDDCRPDPSWLGTLVQAIRDDDSAMAGGTSYNGLPGNFFASVNQLILDMVYEHFNADPERSYFLASNNIACSRARFLELGGFDTTFPRAGGEDRDFCDRWRMKGWPLVWRPAARVEHRHGQSLGRFIDLYLRYGRGAYLFQARRSVRRSGTMKDDFEFHRSLVSRARKHLRAVPGVARRAKVIAALALWQAANASGFALEAMSNRFGPRPSR